MSREYYENQLKESPYYAYSMRSRLESALAQWNLTVAEVPRLAECQQLLAAGNEVDYCILADSLRREARRTYENSDRAAAPGEFVRYYTEKKESRVGRIVAVVPSTRGPEYILRLNYRYDQRQEPLNSVRVSVADCCWLDSSQDTDHPHYIDCSACC